MSIKVHLGNVRPARVFGLVVLMLVMIIGGCVSPKKNEARELSPSLTQKFTENGWSMADNPQQAISPDGKYVSLVRRSESGQKVIAVALDKGTEQVFYSIAKEAFENHYADIRTVSWISSTDFVFVVSGYGARKGQRGLAVYKASVSSGSTDELWFLELPEGYAHSIDYVPSSKAILVRVTGSIWSYSLETRRSRCLVSNLPVYDGLFNAKLSPDGSAYVYHVHDPGKNGIYLLDVASGAEKALLTAGEALYFYPSWSPDGRFVCVYTASRKPGATGTTWENYDFIEGEDGPFPAGRSILVVDREGKKVQEISLADRFVGNLIWSFDSKVLAFGAGKYEKPSQTDLPVFGLIYDSIWYAQLSGQPKKLADASYHGTDVGRNAYPVSFDGAAKGVFYEVFEPEQSTIWYASLSEDKQPATVASGYVMGFRDTPVFGDAVILSIGTAGQDQIWLCGAAGCREITEAKGSHAGIVAWNSEYLVSFRSTGESARELLVFKMFK